MIGWISVKTKLPAFNEYVDVVNQPEMLVIPLWESTGRITRDGNWCIKKADGLTLRNSKPTHWRYIKQQ